MKHRTRHIETDLAVIGTGIAGCAASIFAHQRASAVILATGRFLSGGLVSDRDRLRKPLVGLPVSQPDSREGWFRDACLDPRGQPINRLGVATDAALRPLGQDGAAVSDRLFAAGSLLAGQDWAGQGNGAGLAIATAFGAVQSAQAVPRPVSGEAPEKYP